MKIKFTSPDKVNGKLVKYKKGDCLSIDCNNGNYLAAFISEKFNKYYDLTLLEYYQGFKPTLNDFVNGKFWGTRFGSWKSLTYAVDKKMAACKYIDGNKDIKIIGSVFLIDNLGKASYSYIDEVSELLDYYLSDILIRVEKTKNAEKYPELAFVSKHLIAMKNIIKT
jgi:hypothetical protein